jgi:hypothetical protein
MSCSLGNSRTALISLRPDRDAPPRDHPAAFPDGYVTNTRSEIQSFFKSLVRGRSAIRANQLGLRPLWKPALSMSSSRLVGSILRIAN